MIDLQWAGEVWMLEKLGTNDINGRAYLTRQLATQICEEANACWDAPRYRVVNVVIYDEEEV